jgi:hypothetical protein
MPPTNLWKLTIDPRGKSNPEADSFHFCKMDSIIGIGWRLSSIPKDKKDATCLFRKDHKKGITAFNVIVHRMEIHDHAWVYGKSTYYVCDITSDWSYQHGNLWDDNDIHNIRRATWKEIPIELVPGCVKRNLTMYGTAKRIEANASMLKYSDWLFKNTLNISSISSGIKTNSISHKITSNSSNWLFEVIDADETEDLIGLYIQKDLKWCMIKSSAYRSQRKFECEYRRVSGDVDETAFMQVKSGNSMTLDCKEYVKDIGSTNTYIYLFSNGSTPYVNIGAHSNVITIDMNSIVKFAAANVALLPLPILLKLSIA